MTQRKPLGKKEIDYVKAKVAGKSNTEAAMIATGAKTKDVAKKQGHRLSTNVNVQEALAAAFEAHGITLDVAIAPIQKALNAKKIVIHGNKEDSFAEEVEDIDLQLKGSDRALKLMGIGQPEVGKTINNFIVMSQEQREKYGI